VKKICVVTGTRADYGHLRWVLKGIQKSSALDLRIVATGMHMSPEFGLTYREIEDDGFSIDRKVEMLLSSDTPSSISKSMGLGLISLTDAFDHIRPDLLLLMGDRFEILSAAIVAMNSKIPIAHIHGGESTEGVVDEAIRHSVTKLSYIHFASTENYRNRIIQLGENPERVFNVGAPCIDNINRLKLQEITELEQYLGFKFGQKNLLVTYHPVTLGKTTTRGQVVELLMALEELGGVNIIFTMPNADADGRDIIRLINEFVVRNPKSVAHVSLGQQRYLSCLRHVDGIIGNSSSGLIEAPAMKKGSVNIGDRQRGRIRSDSVIDCAPERRSIARAIKTLFSRSFQEKLRNVESPYGSGGSSDKIVKKLECFSTCVSLKKTFFDLPAR